MRRADLSQLRGPTLDEVDRHVDTLDRAEPQQQQSAWRAAFDALSLALWRARRARRWCAIPAAVFAAILIVVFHGEVWDARDFYNLLAVEGAVLLSARLVLPKLLAVLEREELVVALLRYYGATNLPQEEEEEAFRDVA